MDLLFVTNGDKSHMRTLKTLTDLCLTKQKRKRKNGFVEAVYSVLVIKMC